MEWPKEVEVLQLKLNLGGEGLYLIYRPGGEADVLVAFEKVEAARYIEQLKKRWSIGSQ